MSKASTLNWSFGFSGDGFPVTPPWSSGPLVNAPSPAASEYYALINGSTTIPIPAGTSWIALFPIPNASVQKTWKGANSGDTGTRMSPTNPWFFMFDPAALPANVYVSANGAEQIYVVIG